MVWFQWKRGKNERERKRKRERDWCGGTGVVVSEIEVMGF